MPEKIQTAAFPCEGGQINNLDELTLSSTKPGAAIRMINFEPSSNGGYRRINGYETYIDTEVPGQGKVRGIGVYNGGVIAARQGTGSDATGCNVFYGNGSSWAAVGSLWAGIGTFRFHSYSLFNPCVVICDGLNTPKKWDGTTLTTLTGAPVGATLATDYKFHLAFAKNQVLTMSAPNADTDYLASSGAFELNVGDTIVALRSFREQLIIFCQTRILRLTGNTSFDFALEPITKNIGCIAGDTVQEIGGDLMYLSPDGIRPIGATERIGDFEIESISRNIQNSIEATVPTYLGQDIHSVVVRQKTQYRLLFGSPNVAQEQTQGFLGSVRKGSQDVGWEWGELIGLQSSCAANGYAGNTELVVHGGYDGFVYQQERGNSFGSFVIPERLTLPYNNFGDPFFRKTLYKVKLYAEFEGSSDVYLQVSYDFNSAKVVQPEEALVDDGQGDVHTFSNASFGSATFGARSNQDIMLFAQGSGSSISLDFYSKTSSNPYTIKAVSLEYATGGRH